KIIDSHHILLLLIHYLCAYKKMTGKIVVSFSVTNKVKNLADHYGLETVITKIGFKYIAELMITEDVLVAGEESGGLAIKGHIPERDGVWISLTILEFMASTGKTITQLIEEVYHIVGGFSYDRLDLKLSHEQMDKVKEKLSTTQFDTFGPHKVILYENLDGDKFYFENDCWIMFRLSGTEPVLRIYAQGETDEKVIDLLSAARTTLGL
ncbi:MAG: phosphoglucomutase/phosphomannomutase family protein, partial [Saprospiraceae bacterium]